MFFHLDTNPELSYTLVHSVDKTHALVVTVEVIWLLFLKKISFNSLQTPNKQVYKIQKKICKPHCCHSNQPLSNLHCFLSVARMLLNAMQVSRQKGVKQLSMNISNPKVAVKHSISLRTTFSPNPHLAEEAMSFLFLVP